MKLKRVFRKVKLTANILFSGIGAQERGFRNSGLFDIDVLTTSDIDKEAVLSYAAVHCGMTKKMINEYRDYPSKERMAQDLAAINLGYDVKKDKPYDWFKLAECRIKPYWLASKLSNNLGDISKITELPYADLWTCSFPCTDISVAGEMKGFSPDSGTRSSLLWENIRLLKNAVDNDRAPKYIMFENVKNLVSKKFINDFNNLLVILSDLGFNTYWSLINGKDCGVPQHRERVFAFAIRKDIDTRRMDFPKPFDNGLRLKDILEDEVDDKYYISKEAIQRFLDNQPNSSFSYINSSHVKDTAVVEQIGQLYGTVREPNPLAGRVFNKDCLSPTLRTCSGGNCMPQIVQPINTMPDGTCRTLKSQYAKTSAANFVRNGTFGATGAFDGFSIRKLTPKECWRLMGFNDVDVDRAASVGVSNSKLYSQAGNSIITNCVELLAEHLYKAQYRPSFVCFDERVISNNSGDTPFLLGGVGEINYGKQYRMGNRVYDSNHVAMALLSQPVGNLGGFSYLYGISKSKAKKKLHLRRINPKKTHKAKRLKRKVRDVRVVYDNCINLLPTIETNSVDLILIDPPYLISRPSGFTNVRPALKAKYGKYSIDFGDWDKSVLDLSTILKESYRILKPTGTFIMFYDFWKMQEVKECAEKIGFKQARLGTWNKINPVPVNSKLNYLSNSREFFVTFVKKSKPTFHSEYDNGDYYYPPDECDSYFLPIVHGKERKAHPTQKPLKLISELVSKHSNVGDMVIDFFAGTGTTGVACKNLKRRCVLCEIDKKYIDIINERLNEE